MMKSKIKKALSIGLCAAALCACSVALIACGDEESDKDKGGKKSELIGGFEQSESLSVAFTNDEELLGGSNQHSEPYIYTSDVYPLNTIDGDSIGGIKYNIYQKLRLKRDYTYEYTLEIMVRMVGDTNLNLCKLEANTKGTFTYSGDDGENYTVVVSDPKSGNEKRYGAFITGESNIYSWKMSSSPNYTVDVERLLKQKVEDGESRFDRYLKGKTVAVEKSGTERILYNDVFYVDFMNDIAPYCSYDSSSVPKEEKPDVPDVPPEPPVREKVEDGITLPSVQKSGCDVSVKLGDKNYVVVIADKSVTSATLDGTTVAGKTIGDNSVFEFPVTYDKLNKSLNATVGDSSFSFNATDYLEEIYPETTKTASDMAVASVVANVINAISVLGDGEAALPNSMSGLIFNPGSGLYQGAQWDKRDNMNVVDTVDKTADFSWVSGALGRNITPALTIDGGVPALEFMYNIDLNAHGKITAKLIKGDAEAVDVEIVEKQYNGSTVYAVKAELPSPVDFDDDITVEIYDSGKKMSSATYSVTRAFAAAYLQNGTELKRSADALWALGMSAEWYSEKDAAPYAYNFVNGSYSFGLGEYSYSTAATNPDYGFLFGSRIYVSGKIVDDNSGEVGDDQTFTAARGAATGGKYPFTVALDGARIDGISIADTDGGQGVITIDVKSDSTLDSMLLYNNVYGSINANCDVVITGEEGATLTVLGTIATTGKLTIDGVNVKVKTSGDHDGVACGDLEINGGGLDIEYIGRYATDKSGLKLAGSADIDGKLVSRGFNAGVLLADSTAEQIFAVNGGEVVIDANGYGINVTDVFDDPSANVNTYLSRELVFNGGVTKINVGDNGVCGVSMCNITLKDDAELYVDVKHGVGILGKYEGYWNEWAQAWIQHSSLPAKIKTNTANERTGVMSIIIRDGAIGTVDELILNGGNVYFYGVADNMFETAHGAVITFAHCDVVFENGRDLKTSFGRAIKAEKGDEVITVENTAKAVFKNCDTPIACWSSAEGEHAKFVNNGLVIVDTYKLDLEPPPWDNWSIQLQVENNGQIRSTNYIAP